MALSQESEHLRSNAELVIAFARDQFGQGLAYDEQAIRWLDGYIQRQHEAGDPNDRDSLVSTLGSFLGECIIRSFGGKWAMVDGSWCVQFDEKNAAFPFAKVAKQLENGSGDSVLSFFTGGALGRQARFSVFARAVRISVISSRRLGEFASALSARRIRLRTLSGWVKPNASEGSRRVAGVSSRAARRQLSTCSGLAIHLSYQLARAQKTKKPGLTSRIHDPAKPPRGPRICLDRPRPAHTPCGSVLILKGHFGATHSCPDKRFRTIQLAAIGKLGWRSTPRGRQRHHFGRQRQRD